MIKISNLSFSGWKQFNEVQNFAPGSLNIFIGINGSGKSNLIELFMLIRYLTSRPGKLQSYIIENGYASSLLHYGPDRTKNLTFDLTISSDTGDNYYGVSLKYTKPNRLIFEREEYLYSAYEQQSDQSHQPRSCGQGHEEAKLPEIDNQVAKTINGFLSRISIYQFHNTGMAAGMRTASYEAYNTYLRSNGENIASILYFLNQEYPASYNKIIMMLRRAFPFFENFRFDVLNKQVSVSWKEQGYPYEFHISQASDGMMRTICLFTLLLLPEAMMPPIILLDEPELGLHPAAVSILSSLLEMASKRTQLFVCTQSIQLVDQTDLTNLVVIDRKMGVSTLSRPDEDLLAFWKDEYSNSQLWDKNLIGGRP